MSCMDGFKTPTKWPRLTFSVAPKRDDGSGAVINLARNFANQKPGNSAEGDGLIAKLLKGLNQSYTITQKSNNLLRSTNNLLVRTTFQYGPPLGGGPAYPSGVLGLAKNAQDLANFYTEFTPEVVLSTLDATKLAVDITKYNGLKTLDDYTLIYDGGFQNAMPSGVYPGMLANYTQDLLFSMQRLSSSPYQVRRLNPSSDVLQFMVDDSTVKRISGLTFNQLFQQGRLFYADYRDQANLTATSRYSSACDAYFYIDSTSGNFLPLAIRTNAGTSLTYTPLDDPNDWLLAKVMFNVCDFWFSQWNHLATTHEVVQIVWAAAIRSISQEHPVFGILNRLTYQVYSIPVMAEAVLFLPLGSVDLLFPYTGASARSYTTNRYKYGGAGRFQGNYFSTNLKKRGLIGSSFGPALKSFPFYEDGRVIFDAIHTFMTSFVQSYYSSDAEVAADQEIQTWVAECNGPAECIDFPSQISTRATLVDVLPHVAHLGSISHHTINTNELLKASGVLPFCPISLYHSPPTKKGTGVNVVDYLPRFDGILLSSTLATLFARPLIAGSDRTIIHMFDDQQTMKLMNAKTRDANTAFIASMKSFSALVSARSFGSDGLSQGMPFVWKALDPNVAPYSVST